VNLGTELHGLGMKWGLFVWVWAKRQRKVEFLVFKHPNRALKVPKSGPPA